MPGVTAPDQLREWITRRGFKDYEAATFLGISGGYLSELLAGKKVPALETALSLEDKTGITVRSWKLSGVSNSETDGDRKPRKRPGLAG